MASFSKALNYTLKNEGGFVDIPEDKGGPTNCGITISTLSFYFNRRADKEDIKVLTPEIISSIYKKYYWDPLHLDLINSDAVATAMFDQGVNRSPGTIAREIQLIVGVKPDGLIGHATITAINDHDEKDLVNNISQAAAYEYKRIVLNNPSQDKFLKGWLRRAEEIKQLV